MEALNVSYYDGTLRKEGGAAKYNSSVITGAPSILGGWDHRTNALGQRMIVACNDGKLYKDSGGGTFSVTLKTGLSTAMRPFFVDGGKEAAANNRKLFIFTGTDVVQVLADDAATTANIATPPTDWTGSNQPSFGEIHNNRLFAGGNANDPHRIYYSTLTNQEDFTGAGSGSFAIYPGKSDGLVGALSLQGLLILWKKPLGVYILDTRDPNTANWFVKEVTDAVGGISPWGQVQTDDDVIFIDSTGAIQSLRAVQEFGDVAGRNLGQTAFLEPLLRTEFSLGALANIRGGYYTAKREVHFAYASSGASVNDSRLVIDLYRPDKPRFRLSDRDICVSLWLRRDSTNIPRVMVGDNVGFVWQLDQDARNKDNAPYSSIAKTVPTDLGWASQEIAHRFKNAAFLELVYEPTSFNQVTVDLEWDGRYRETVVFALTPTAGVFDNLFLDGNFILGSSGYAFTKKHRITGGGKYLSLIFKNAGVNEDFSIARARLYFTLGTE